MYSDMFIIIHKTLIYKYIEVEGLQEALPIGLGQVIIQHLVVIRIMEITLLRFPKENILLSGKQAGPQA